MKEFKINDYISLRLEKDKTNVYINGEKIIQCKYLLLQDPDDKSLVDEEDFLSIDRLSEKLDKTLELDDSVEAQNYQIDSEIEFWAHCSNIQAWAENNYDTQMLHANLSFPLLKATIPVRPQERRLEWNGNRTNECLGIPARFFPK